MSLQAYAIPDRELDPPELTPAQERAIDIELRTRRKALRHAILNYDGAAIDAFIDDRVDTLPDLVKTILLYFRDGASESVAAYRYDQVKRFIDREISAYLDDAVGELETA